MTATPPKFIDTNEEEESLDDRDLETLRALEASSSDSEN